MKKLPVMMNIMPRYRHRSLPGDCAFWMKVILMDINSLAERIKSSRIAIAAGVLSLLPEAVFISLCISRRCKNQTAAAYRRLRKPQPAAAMPAVKPVIVQPTVPAPMCRPLFPPVFPRPSSL